MGNQTSSTSSSGRRRSARSPETAAERAKKVIGDLNEELKKSVKTLDDDHPAAQLIDHVCGGYFDDDKYGRNSRSASFYSEDVSEDGSRTISEDDTYDDRSRRSKNDKSVESSSYMSQSDYDSDSKRRSRKASNSFDTEEESKAVSEVEPATLISKPLASSFAKRCYFTKAGIGKTTQHYEGLTLTGNVVLMLAAAMKLKGCPTICDEDLRRVEQTYPNQFSRLPDELLLSSGWRRISKYCHFSNKPIPDGIPFFHSKQRLHPSGGYYFLLAAAVGMVRPLDVEPLTKDTLVLLETDYPGQCDATPSVLVRDPDQWTLVNKFCFFSGGPINTEEDVYYQADFDGNPIYMLAFLSPSLTPEELYKLKNNDGDEPGLKTVAAVQEVESVYDLTERDFDDLKLYHLGPCRALPQYILQPQAWTKVLPPHFLAAREDAMVLAQDWEARHSAPGKSGSKSKPPQPAILIPPDGADDDEGAEEFKEEEDDDEDEDYRSEDIPAKAASYYEDEVILQPPPKQPQQKQKQQQQPSPPPRDNEFQRQIEEEGAFVDDNAPMDEAFASRFPLSPPGTRTDTIEDEPDPDIPDTPKLDPPERDNEPPSLTRSGDDVPAGFDDPPQFFPEEDFPGDNSFDGNNNFIQQHFRGDNSNSHRSETSFRDSNNTRGNPAFLAENFRGDNDSPVDGDIRVETSYHIDRRFRGERQYNAAHQYRGGDGFPPDSHFRGENQFHTQNGSFDDPDPAFSDPGFSDPGLMTPHGEPSIGADGFFEDNYYESPEKDDFGAPYYDDEPRPSPLSQMESPGDEDFNDDDFDNPVSPQQPEFDRPQGHYPMTPPTDDEMYGGADEKKFGIDPSDMDDSRKSGEEDFIPIKRNGYQLNDGPSPRSMDSISMDSQSHQSSALRGAQDILRKNRRRRVEMAMKQSMSESEPNPASTQHRDDASESTWESGSEMTGSIVSGSSVWSEGSTGDRSSRRALILQMAKARMKTKGSITSPEKEKTPAAPIVEEDANTEAGNTDIDFPIDLD